jgi:hypothetical protein
MLAKQQNIHIIKRNQHHKYLQQVIHEFIKGKSASQTLNEMKLSLHLEPDIDGLMCGTISNTSQGFQINFWVDAMNNPQKSISGDKRLQKKENCLPQSEQVNVKL